MLRRLPLLLVAALLGCSTDTEVVTTTPPTPWSLANVQPSLWLDGTQVSVTIAPSDAPKPVYGMGPLSATARLEIAANATSKPIAVLPLTTVDGLVGMAQVAGPQATALAKTTLSPLACRVVFDDVTQAGVHSACAIAGAMGLDTSGYALSAAAPWRLGSELTVTANALPAAEEGIAALRIEGTFTPSSGATRPIEVALPVEVSTIDRTMGAVPLDARWIGPEPGLFTGSARLVVHTTTMQDPAISPPQPLSGTLLAASLAPHGPLPPPGQIAGPRVRRGGALRVIASGVPRPAPGTATLLRLAGAWAPSSGQGQVWTAETGPLLAVEPVPGDTFAQAHIEGLWKMVGGPIPVEPGLFIGAFRLVLIGPGGVWQSDPVDAGYTMRRDVQRVVVRFLPSFGDAVHRLGLRHAWVAQAAIVARVQALYAGHGAVVEDADQPSPQVDVLHPPLLEHITVDVGDRDPNGAALLGNEPTAGKDTGNLILDEHLGGYDGAGAAQSSYGFGGVFAGEILRFSPSLPEPSVLADPAFDVIFGPFCPSLGGTPYAGSTQESGDRTIAWNKAIDAFAHVIGGTIAHEVGHALGLSASPDLFHDPGDTPGHIMDAGIYRPFAERAGLPGAPQETWGPVNEAYLESILAKPNE